MSIIERLYSDAFEDGINYAIEKLYSFDSWQTGNFAEYYDNDSSKELKRMRDKRERLSNYNPEKNHGFMSEYAVKKAKELDEEGYSDETIRRAVEGKAGLKGMGRGALIGGGIGTLPGLVFGKNGKEKALAAGTGALMGALVGGPISGDIASYNADRAIHDIMSQRDRDILLRKKIKEENKKKGKK